MTRLGMDLPFHTPDGDVPRMPEIARRARAIEAAGFDNIWMGDGFNRGFVRPDALTWLTTAAAVTERVEIITAVYQLPLRPAIDTAARMLSLHALTNGRFVAGVGSGSTQADFDAAGLDFSTRFRVFAESLDAIQRLWRGEQVGAGHLHPWPSTLGGPPVVIGSWAGSRWIKRAAEEYDGWVTSGMKTNLRTLREGIQRYRDFGGKRAMVSSVFVDLSKPNAGLTEDEPFTLECGPESARERFERLLELGYDDVLIGMSTTHVEADEVEDRLVHLKQVLTG